MKTVFLLLFLFVVLSCGRNSSNDATPQDILPAATTLGGKHRRLLGKRKSFNSKEWQSKYWGTTAIWINDKCD